MYLIAIHSDMIKSFRHKGHWSVWVNGNWRLIFTFEGSDAVLVDYQDYH